MKKLFKNEIFLNDINELIKNPNKWILPNVQYFMNNFEKLCDENYSHTFFDHLNIQNRTWGIHKTLFDYKEHKIDLWDVGGQRRERRKWIYSFEDLKNCIFVVSVNSINECLFEDSETNGFDEVIKLFEEIYKNIFFHDVQKLYHSFFFCVIKFVLSEI